MIYAFSSIKLNIRDIQIKAEITMELYICIPAVCKCTL